MNLQRRQLLPLLAGAITSSPASLFANANDYPSRAITLMVGFAAGGPTDVYACVLAESLQNSLGVPVKVENVNGAAGSIAAGRVATAAPDGYKS
jgi:tripartite-type tricarboxylate transporter receptor subunit TctC